MGTWMDLDGFEPVPLFLILMMMSSEPVVSICLAVWPLFFPSIEWIESGRIDS